MLATSTHDNKRSEDVRARLNVLSELPEAWSQCLLEWSTLNLAHKTRETGDAGHEAGALMPDRNDEYLLYQVLLGAWPLAAAPQAGSPWGILLPPDDGPEFEAFVERAGQYMNKAIKEAKVHGSWINPDLAYDEAMQSLIREILLVPERGEPHNRFLAAFAALAAQVAFFGQVNSLAQLALKLTSPGVPDLYQGNEAWDFSLVDPDNRRPVDYGRREDLLAALPAAGAAPPALLQELLAHSHDGRIKLYVTSRLLDARRDHEALFRSSNYTPLAVIGTAAEHVIAFARRAGRASLIVVAARLPATLMGGELRWPVGPETWGDTEVVLPANWSASRMIEALTGRDLPVGPAALRIAEALDAFPLAVLISP